MVLLTMTETMVKAVAFCDRKEVHLFHPHLNDGEPSLEAPAVGNPISHAQIIAISRCLRQRSETASDQPPSNSDLLISHHLDELLRGSKVYVEPPKPRAEPTSEYKVLMARLRREEEARNYERMINPALPMQSFAQRFPNSTHTNLFESNQRAVTEEDDEITYADINRQMALIINILVSIVACSVAIWMASGHWSTPRRLGLSMGGSSMVGVAEVVVYAGYLRRIKEAKEKGKKHIEIKEVIKTWVIGGEDEKSKEDSVRSVKVSAEQRPRARRRLREAN